MSIIQLVIIAINLNVFLLGILFFFIPKGNLLANRMLGLFLTCVGYLTFSMTMLEDIVLLPFLIRVFEPFSLLLLPSLYLYYVRLEDQRNNFSFYEWLHFAPPILSLAVIFPFLVKSDEYKIEWLHLSIQDYSFYTRFNYLLAIQLIIYIVLFALKINYFYSKDYIKGDKGKVIARLKHFIVFMLVTFTIGLILMFLFTPDLYFLAIPVQLIVLYGIFLLIKSSKLLDVVYTSSPAKPFKSDVSRKIDEYLDSSEDFFSPGISLEIVSSKINVSIHEISRYINDNKNLNFNEFVNKKRIEEAKKRLHENEWKHLSFDGVGHSVGFKSKTTFYRAFKKFTGYTPGEYRKEMAIEKPH
jgi:AraC-like DNA-binding protein